MCTCIMVKNKNTYFGRNMDLHYSFDERVIIVPRNFKLSFKLLDCITNHYAIIGIGTVVDNYPLFAEASNEKGLSIAALNFMGNAFYYQINNKKINLAPYELFTYLLAKFKTINEVKKFLKRANIVDINFNEKTLLTPLHFMISDKNSSIVLESCEDGLHVYDNPYNVLTNNPIFPYHKENVKNYMHLSIEDPKDNFNLGLSSFSYNQGCFGLPGDFSSSSRFVKALFIKNNMSLINNELDSIRQFFYCLESVRMVIGLVKVENTYEYSRYTSCINVDKSILYYKTYEGGTINKIDMHTYDLNNDKLYKIKLDYTLNIKENI